MAWVLTRLVLGQSEEVLGSFPKLSDAKKAVRRRVGPAVTLAWRSKGNWHTTQGETSDIAYDVAPADWQPPQYTGPAY